MLPEPLGIDELTAAKENKGKYAFIIVDYKKSLIYYIVENFLLIIFLIIAHHNIQLKQIKHNNICVYN